MFHSSIAKNKQNYCYFAPEPAPHFTSEFPVCQKGSSGEWGPPVAEREFALGSREPRETELSGTQCEALLSAALFPSRQPQGPSGFTKSHPHPPPPLVPPFVGTISLLASVNKLYYQR